MNSILANLSKGDISSTEADCFVHHKKKIIFVLIPKCATKSMMISLPRAGFKFNALNNFNVEGYEIVTVIRNPLDRWISGFATWLTIRVAHEDINHDKALDIFDNKDDIDYITNQVGFDIHTKPQFLFLQTILHIVNYFSIENMESLFNWFAYRNILVDNIYIHRTGDFDKDSFHRVAYGKIKKLLGTNQRLFDNVTNFYKEDIKLYKILKNFKECDSLIKSTI